MTNTILSPKERAFQHLQAALATGVRGALRDGIKALLVQATAVNGTPRAELEYRNLAPGAKLRCPAHPGLLMRKRLLGLLRAHDEVEVHGWPVSGRA